MNVPLKFIFIDFVAGAGFIAHVEMTGSALLTDKGGEPWIHGVQPGCLAGGGPSVGDALWSFREGYLSVLYDLAKECPTFDDFLVRVFAFQGSVNGPYSEEYVEALTTVTRKEIEALELLNLPDGSLPLSVEVTNVVPGHGSVQNFLPTYYAVFGS